MLHGRPGRSTYAHRLGTPWTYATRELGASPMTAKLGVIILAAGQGTRMKSALPKVAHPVAGKPMVAHIIDAARELSPAAIAVVVGHGSEQVIAAIGDRPVTFVTQHERLGTANAVAQCRAATVDCDTMLILNGDSPLVTAKLLGSLVEGLGDHAIALVGTTIPEPGGMGRIVRDPASGNVTAVVEAADWDGPGGPWEINAGQYCFDAAWLWANIDAVPLSPKGEYYLTSLFAMAIAQSRTIAAVTADAEEVLGVDDRVRLSEVEGQARRRILEQHMRNGVTIIDPATTYIDADVAIEQDVTIYPGTHLQQHTRVATGAVIGPGAVLRNAIVGENCAIQSAVIEESRLGNRVRVGPFCHIRGNATLADDCELGNYAEVKNSVLGIGVKMHHFSYLGDADVGEHANIAAGAITCNYDGVHKHRTVIGDRAFIGCDTMMVAPVTIGADAFTATGAVVIRDVPPGERVAGVPARPLPRKEGSV